jgi:hypothetical protein
MNGASCGREDGQRRRRGKEGRKALSKWGTTQRETGQSLHSSGPAAAHQGFIGGRSPSALLNGPEEEGMNEEDEKKQAKRGWRRSEGFGTPRRAQSQRFSFSSIRSVHLPSQSIPSPIHSASFCARPFPYSG